MNDGSLKLYCIKVSTLEHIQLMNEIAEDVCFEIKYDDDPLTGYHT